MTDTNLPPLTVTEAAVIDLERQKEAMARRARNFDPSAGLTAREGTLHAPDYVDAICSPVRVEITFGDPLHTRQQIEALQAALVEALVITQDHGRGLSRQRLDLHSTIKHAARTLVYMNGKTPAGHRKARPR